MKQTAVAKTLVRAPIEVVFETFTNHETYRQLFIVRDSTLVAPGEKAPSNGLGAVRWIDVGVGTLKETVVGVDRPHYWDYHFSEWPMPYVHAGGRMAFESVPGGTMVTWETSFDANTSFLKRAALPLVVRLNGHALKLASLMMGRIAERKAKR